MIMDYLLTTELRNLWYNCTIYYNVTSDCNSLHCLRNYISKTLSDILTNGCTIHNNLASAHSRASRKCYLTDGAAEYSSILQ